MGEMGSPRMGKKGCWISSSSSSSLTVHVSSTDRLEWLELTPLCSRLFQLNLASGRNRKWVLACMQKLCKEMGTSTQVQIAHTSRIHNVYTTCTQRIHNVYTTYTQRIHNVYTTSTQRLNNVYTPCTHRVHNVYTTYTQRTHTTLMYTPAYTPDPPPDPPLPSCNPPPSARRLA